MKIAFTGKNIGGVRMRGVDVAERLGVPFININKLKLSDRFNTLVLVKYWDDPLLLRRCCDQLIFDPLDCWSSTKPNAKPCDFWQWTRKLLQFDEIIATSPACLESMACLPESKVIGHMLPHHADLRVGPDWHNPNGPVVYAGGRRFISSALPQIESACKQLGRNLLLDHGRNCWRRLQGASLCLHLRLPPEDTLLNQYCKPQVKLENTAAAGLPILATCDPCVTWRKNLTCAWRDAVTNGINWETWIEFALAQEPLMNPVTLEQHADNMAKVLEL